MKPLALLAALLFVFSTTAVSQNRLVSYQAYLESGGVPLAGPHTLQFKVYVDAAGGAPLWEETHSVTLENGIFEVALGSHLSLEGVNLLKIPYLEIWVDGEPFGTRSRFASAPSALDLAVPAVLAASTQSGQVLTVINGAPSGESHGILGKTNSPSGTGLYGEATASSSLSAFGVEGVSKATSGTTAGVRGSGKTGVWGETESGIGVFGSASAVSGTPVGVQGQVGAAGGTGVKGIAGATSGANKGVHGLTSSSSGYGGYFEGGTALYAESVNGTKPDLLLAGTTDSDDNGWLTSDPAYTSSDLSITSYDDVNLQLDRDGNDAGVFWISNQSGDDVFSVDEAGNVKVNGVLQHSSDRERKEDFGAVDPDAILNGIAGMEIGTWRFRGDSALHLGPTAQDFGAAFGLGGDDNTTIATVDADGVALVAIQALHRMVFELRADNAALREELRRMKSTAP